MLLTSQRVRSQTGAVAIHAFFYVHGDYLWVGPPPPLLAQGVLQASHVELGTPNNAVLSYLDIMAPDAVELPELKSGFATAFLMDRSPPWRHTVGRCTFEENMISPLRTIWRQESLRLFEAAMAVRIRLV